MNQLTSSILYSLFTERRSENWVFSPASYLEAMSLLALCLKDENLSELLAVAPDIRQSQARGLDTYNVLLYAAEYRDALDQVTMAAVQACGGNLEAFDGPAIISRVNAIVREKTHGKIDSLLSPSDYSDLLKFVILNCVYFKRAWLHDFEDNGGPQPFHGAVNETKVKYLHHRIKGQRYHEDAALDIVELPYKDSNVACYVIVPRVSLFEVFSDLRGNLAKIGAVKAGLDVDLTVPSFKTETTIPLNELTQNAGVRRIFGWSKEFTMVDWSKLHPDMLCAVTDIRQKVFIDFTKKGTEAAAVTSITMCYISGCCMRVTEPPPVKYVRVDKPFLYVLADRDNHKPLFVGVVNEVPDSPDTSGYVRSSALGDVSSWHPIFGNLTGIKHL